ncbi:hypothetical protein Aperf_G00000079571 [Anoplocephala perfoliata]
MVQVVWELGQSTAPFTLSVENLRPDLVRVDMPPLPTTSLSRQRRSSDESRWFGYHGDASATETKNNSDPVQSQPEWLGPTVFLLREDESFIGEFLGSQHSTKQPINPR